MSNPIEQSIAALEQKIEKYEGQIVEWQEEIDRLDGKSNPLPSELREKQDILQHAVDALVSVSLDLGKQAKVMTLTDVHTPQAIPDNVKLDMALKPYKDRVMQLFEQELNKQHNLSRAMAYSDAATKAGSGNIVRGYAESRADNLKQLSEGDNYARSK